MQWYLNVVKNYVGFQGRARRKEYWMFVLFNIIFALALFILGYVTNLLFLYYLYVLAVFLPSLAVEIRRLHDTGRTGWWMLIALVPFAGAIVLLIFFVLDSDPQENRFGPNPKADLSL